MKFNGWNGEFLAKSQRKELGGERERERERLPEGNCGENTGGGNGVDESEFLLHRRCENQMPALFDFAKLVEGEIGVFVRV